MPALQWHVMPNITMPDEKDPFVIGDDHSLMRDMEREEWEALERQARREEWDEKHARCDACGQFLKKRAVVEGSLQLDLSRRPYPWVSHYVQDYWGEWDHI